MKTYQMTNEELISGIKVLSDSIVNKEGFDSLVSELVRRAQEFEEIEENEIPKCACGYSEFEHEGPTLVCVNCGKVYKDGV